MKGKIRSFIKNNWLIISIWTLAFLVRILASVFSKGYIHPDEHYQSIEIAYYEIYGEGYIPWEFDEGIRSWVYPGIVLMIFKTLIWLGITNIETILIFVRLFSACCSMITVVTAYYFGKDIFDKKVGLISTIFVSFWSDFIFWSVRTLTDSIAFNFSFLGVYLLVHYMVKKQGINQKSDLDKKSKRKKGIIFGLLAGIMFGLSFIFKFPTVILALPFSLWLLIKKKWSAVSFLVIGIGTMVVIQGIIDVFTWGSFLHSPIGFLNYNIITGQNKKHGIAPFLSYPFLMFDNYGDFFLLFLLFFFFGLKKERKALWVLFSALSFLIVFSCIAHKEYRFILPIMPILVIFAAKGFLEYPKKIKRYNIRKGILTFLAIFTLGCSVANTFYFKSFQPNNQFCQAVISVCNQEDAEYLIVIDNLVYYTPGLAYRVNTDVNMTFANYLIDYYCIIYEHNQYYIIIRQSIFDEYHDYLTRIFEYRNVTLFDTFEGTHWHYDESIYIFKNIVIP